LTDTYTDKLSAIPL